MAKKTKVKKFYKTTSLGTEYIKFYLFESDHIVDEYVVHGSDKIEQEVELLLDNGYQHISKFNAPASTEVVEQEVIEEPVEEPADEGNNSEHEGSDDTDTLLDWETEEDS